MPDYFVSFADIARRVPSAPTVVVHSDFAEPQTLVRRFAEQAALFSGARVYSLMPMAEPAYLEGEAARHIQAVSFFPGGGLRRAVNSGAARIHRCNLSEIGALFDGDTLRADLLLLQVSRPNHRGEVSLGVSVDYMPAVLAQKPLVVAQINAQMPFTSGATAIPLDAIDYVIEQDEPLVAFGESRADDLDQIIARHVAGLVNDGDVIQAGIGALPDRVLANLGHLKHLGGHTGIITAAWRTLIESGVVDNSRKPIFRGVTLTTMAGGDQGFYDFLHHNPAVEFHPCALTHDFNLLRAIPNLCAINSVLQLDLAASGNAEQVGGRIIAAPGGLVDFARGASAAPGGKSIIALRSSFVAKNGGRLSNILPALDPGQPVTLAGEHVGLVVTEYGVADLRGASPAQKAQALIAVAHPEHRAWLESRGQQA